MNLAEKETLVAGYEKFVKADSAAFLVDFTGTTCEDLTGVRRKLKGAGAQLVVAKNTLVKRAIKDTPADGLKVYLKGPTAVIWATDPVEPAKILTDFAKDKESFKVKGGYVDGSVVDAKGVEALAKLPSKQQLQAQLLALINAPATQLVRLINAPATNTVRLLDAWRSELEKKG